MKLTKNWDKMTKETLAAMSDDKFGKLLSKAEHDEANDWHLHTCERKLLVDEVMRRNPELRKTGDLAEDFLNLVLGW